MVEGSRCKPKAAGLPWQPSLRLTVFVSLVSVVFGLLGCAQQVPMSVPLAAESPAGESVIAAPVRQSAVESESEGKVRIETVFPDSDLNSKARKALRRSTGTVVGYSIPVLKPNPNIDYKIAQMKIDPDIDYKIQQVIPGK